MIQSLRYYSDSWIFKGLLSLIVFCFVFLGVGDLIKSVVYDRPIAIVGSHTISMEELDHAVKSELRRIESIQKQSIKLSDLNQFGFIQKILDRLVGQHLLTQEIDKLKIVASDKVVRQNIKGLQPFLKDGQFDPSQFKTILQNIGISEQMLVKDIRKQIMDQQYFLSFSEAATIPSYYRDLLIDAMTKKRSFATVTIETKSIILDQRISDDDLKSFYEAHKEKYKKEEERDVLILKLDLNQLSKKVSITEEELNQVYLDRKDTYIEPEKRTIKKLIFKSEEEAQDIYKLLEKKKSVKDIQKERKGLEIASFESISKNEWSDDNTDKVFSLSMNENSGIIAQNNTFCIYVIESIEKQIQKSFSDVKAEIEKELRIERFQEDYKTLKHKIDDDLAGGASIESLSKELQLELINVKNITADNKALEKLSSLKGMEKDIIEQTFQLNEGHASNVIDSSFDKGFVVFVSKIKQAAIPDIQEIKEKVKNDVTSEKKKEKAAKIAQQISQESKSVSDLAKLAAKHEVSLKTNNIYSRLSIAEDKNLIKNKSINIFDRAFSLPLNRAIAGATEDGFIVIMPEKDLEDKSIDETKRQEIIKRLNVLMNDAIANLMIENLKKKYSVDIKTKNLEAFLKIVLKSE